MNDEKEQNAAEIVGSFPQNADPVQRPKLISQSETVEPLPTKKDFELPEIPDASNEVSSGVATTAHHQVNRAAVELIANQNRNK